MMDENFKIYVTVMDKYGHTILFNEEIESDFVSHPKEANVNKDIIHKFKLSFVLKEKREDIPDPKFKIGDKVKTKTGSCIWDIYNASYSLKRNKWIYDIRRIRKTGERDGDVYEEENLRKVEDK